MSDEQSRTTPSRGLTVCAGVRVVGVVNVEIAHILGVVEGNVNARSVCISESAEVTGDVLYEKLVFDEGVPFGVELGGRRSGTRTVPKRYTAADG
jgi:cytoskeletal protein CcmA (bactofilin family)